MGKMRGSMRPAQRESGAGNEKNENRLLFSVKRKT